MLVPGALAQSSVVRSGSLEVGPFVGATYGIQNVGVMGGGNVTYALANRYVLPYFEFSYFPGLPHSYTDASGTKYDYSISLADLNGGVHIRIPIGESPVVPYLVAGIGALHYFQGSGTATPTSGGLLAVTFPPGTSFAFNAGGGIRYYIGGSGRFGFRLEAKFYKPNSGPFSNDTIGKVEAGFFFQVH
jgi:hypothetical protein